MLYYTKTVKETLDELETSEHGLSESVIDERRRIHGPNAILLAGEPFWRKLIEPFANVFMLVLFIAVVVSAIKGEVFDATIIGVIMAVSAIIYYVQRFSTERILRSLQRHSAQQVTVIRDSKVLSIDATELVPGDVIELAEGEKVPADGRIVTSDGLRIDEAQLTGESQPISKTSEALRGDQEIYDQTNMLFQGSFVIAGSGQAVVVATGNTTEFGRLAALSSAPRVESPVQQKIDALIKQIIIVVAAIALVAFGLALFRGMELTEAARFVMALAVSAVPESLPVAISVVLVLGMRRMAAKKALVRAMRAIETVGVITTIATDKTGTLTQNKLTVQETWQLHPDAALFARTLAATINNNSKKLHDPLDSAFDAYATHNKISLPTQPPLHSLPFELSKAMSGNLWHHGRSYELFIKGAPEQVIHASSLTESEQEKATMTLHQLTGQGYRVIALAHSNLQREITSVTQLTAKDHLTFVGFVAVADILRPEAKRAITTAQNAGVTVRMITGDHFETAYHIGTQLGLVKSRDEVFDSRKMNVMSDEELDEIIEKIRVFSRVIPEHKYRILSLLKKRNITAMTGDGVNDVPALTNAHVGVAMGSGTQIAKDAGDIILLDDNFKSIIDAMREGRTILGNIRRMLFYLLSTSSGEVLVALGALILGMPLPLVPVQILWVNLVTDTAMVIPLGLEPGRKNSMKHPPKAPNTPILNKFMLSRMILVAVTMMVVVLGLYAFYSNRFDHAYGSTLAFIALVAMQWANAFNARSNSEPIKNILRIMNVKFYVGLAIAISLQALAVFGPLKEFLHVGDVALSDMGLVTLIAIIIPIVVVEIHKYIGKRIGAHVA